MDIWTSAPLSEIRLSVCNRSLILRHKGSLDTVDKLAKSVILGHFAKKNYVVIGDEEIVKLSIDHFSSSQRFTLKVACFREFLRIVPLQNLGKSVLTCSPFNSTLLLCLASSQTQAEVTTCVTSSRVSLDCSR